MHAGLRPTARALTCVCLCLSCRLLGTQQVASRAAAALPKHWRTAHHSRWVAAAREGEGYGCHMMAQNWSGPVQFLPWALCQQCSPSNASAPCILLSDHMHAAKEFNLGGVQGTGTVPVPCPQAPSCQCSTHSICCYMLHFTCYVCLWCSCRLLGAQQVANRAAALPMHWTTAHLSRWVAAARGMAVT